MSQTPDGNMLNRWRCRSRAFPHGKRDKQLYYIVKSVLNVAGVHWAADILLRQYLIRCHDAVRSALKTKRNPSGLYTEQEVYDMFIILFTLTFLGTGDNEHDFSLHWAATQVTGVLHALIDEVDTRSIPQDCADQNAVLGFISNVSKFLRRPSDKPCCPPLSKLSETGRPLNELVGMILGISMMASSVTSAQAATHAINLYLDDTRATERAKIVKLESTAASRPTLPFRLVKASLLSSQGRRPHLGKLQERASQCTPLPSPTADFRNPTAVDPTRPASSYRLLGSGFHIFPGLSFAEQTVAEALKAVFKLKNVRRAAGDAGRLPGFKILLNGTTEMNVYKTPYGT
ncbi:hypothetical protein B0H14DRAFT_2571760 [Mycena olivaceomarginata]|nr:hypothetical protein B0H14DRAFT_2571760 [Mycena olivaceomarginata]